MYNWLRKSNLSIYYKPFICILIQNGALSVYDMKFTYNARNKLDIFRI